MDTELEKAIEKADYIPQVIQHMVSSFRFLGAVQGKRGMEYFYYDRSEDKYYKEADIDREMRAAIRRSQLKRYAKK